MANILAAQTGAWSSTSTWTGGVLPGASDVAIANGKTITIDQDITVVALDNTTLAGATAGGGFVISSTGGGTRTLALSEGLGNYTGTRIGAAGALLTVSATSGTVALNNIRGGASTNYRALDITASGVTIAVSGNVWGGTGANAYGVSSTSSSYTLTVGGEANPTFSTAHAINAGSGAPTITVGSVYGGTGNNQTSGIYATGAAIIAATNVYGGSTANGNGNTYGIHATGAATITAENVYGGAATNGHGIYATHASAIIDLGNVTAGVSAGAYLIGPTTVRAHGDLTYAATGRAPIVSNFLMIQSGEPTTWMCVDDTSWPTGGALIPLSNALEGVPAAADVRAGTTFGAGGSLTGTLSVPPASSVAAGVPVDATTGTAALLLADVAAVTGAQIAAAVTA